MLPRLRRIILASALPSLRISPLLAFVLVGTGTLLFNVMYIQSIGSGLTSFGDLFNNFLLVPNGSPEEISLLLFSSLTPIKPKRLTKAEKEAFLLPETLKQILVGLIMGDLHVYKQKLGINTSLVFEQGLVHKDYIYHLYELFEIYCRSAPKISNRLPDKRTGNIYTRIQFSTYTLPCFNEFYNLFYPKGIKIIPNIIGELLTPLSLAYWICDDGGWIKRDKIVKISTNSFTLAEVNLLVEVLNNKFHLKCYVSKHTSGYVITIPSYSISVLQELLALHIPSMMRYKIGL